MDETAFMDETGVRAARVRVARRRWRSLSEAVTLNLRLANICDAISFIRVVADRPRAPVQLTQISHTAFSIYGAPRFELLHIGEAVTHTA